MAATGVESETAVDQAELVRLMAAMADDQAMVVPFVEAVGHRLRGVVRRILADFGRRDLLADVDEVEGCVWDAALVIQARAGAWRPGAALPWSWAFVAIRSEVARTIGHATTEVDPDQLQVLEGPPAGSVDTLDLDEMAARSPELRLLLEAVSVVRCQDVHKQVHVEYRVQSALGDPSPAHTVADQFGLRPDHVRQIDRRVRSRLAQLVADEERYRGLRGLPWITARATSPPASELVA